MQEPPNDCEIVATVVPPASVHETRTSTESKLGRIAAAGPPAVSLERIGFDREGALRGVFALVALAPRSEGARHRWLDPPSSSPHSRMVFGPFPRTLQAPRKCAVARLSC